VKHKAGHKSFGSDAKFKYFGRPNE